MKKLIDAEKMIEYIKEECRKCYIGNRDLLQLQINIQNHIDSLPYAQVNVPSELNDILDCIAKFDKQATMEEAAQYFQVIQKDVINYLKQNNK